MIFSELYSAYYGTVAAILAALLSGEKSEKDLQAIVTEHAFGESVLTVLPSLKQGKWQLMHKDLTTPLTHAPTMPLTLLQRRWLKAIADDPRFRLFGVEMPDLGDVPPLFTQQDICVYDRYADGDPYEDEAYIRHFRTVLAAIREGASLQLESVNRYGRIVRHRCRPLRLEYSEKDDKFRVITHGTRRPATLNLARIRACSLCTEAIPCAEERCESAVATATVRITDERNAMERFLLHFAHFEKQSERIDGTHYLVRIRYAEDDHAEMVIRLLSFGPMAEVLGPDTLRQGIIDKLKMQIGCGLK